MNNAMHTKTFKKSDSLSRGKGCRELTLSENEKALGSGTRPSHRRPRRGRAMMLDRWVCAGWNGYRTLDLNADAWSSLAAQRYTNKAQRPVPNFPARSMPPKPTIKSLVWLCHVLERMPRFPDARVCRLVGALLAMKPAGHMEHILELSSETFTFLTKTR